MEMLKRYALEFAVGLTAFLGTLCAVHLVETRVSRPVPEDGWSCPPEGEERVPVVIARVDLPARTRTTAGMMELVWVPASVRHSDAATNVKCLLDHQLLVDVLAREQLLLGWFGESSRWCGKPSRRPGPLRAVSIPITMDRAVGGYVDVDQHVDVIGTFRTPRGLVTKPVVRSVRVLAINGRPLEIRNSEPPTAVSAVSVWSPLRTHPPAGFGVYHHDIQAVTLEVTPEEAEKLALAVRTTQLHLAIMNPDETPSSEPYAVVCERDLLESVAPDSFSRTRPPAAPPSTGDQGHE